MNRSSALAISWLILLVGACLSPLAAWADNDQGCQDHCEPAPLVQNQFWTSAYGPAQANVVESGSNFLLCEGNRYALCYYSGPDRKQMPATRFGDVPAPVLTCTTSAAQPGVAVCECYAIDQGKNYVDINSISNTEAYIETARACGTDGSKCRNLLSELGCRSAQQGDDQDALDQHCDLPTAPVCSYLGDPSTGTAQDLVPGYDRLSTFSFDHAIHYNFGSTACTDDDSKGLYAGCMTAPCTDYTGADGNTYSRCQCPTYDGPYQVGQNDAICRLDSGYVWSAAYSPNAAQSSVQATLNEAGGLQP